MYFKTPSAMDDTYVTKKIFNIALSVDKRTVNHYNLKYMVLTLINVTSCSEG